MKNYQVGKTSYDPQSVINLGKKEFIKLHPHIEDASDVYDKIKAAHPEIKATKEV